MWELDHKEGWALKTWCFQTVVLEKTLESPLDSKEIKPVSPKGNQPWIFTGRTDAEPEAPILWPPDANSWFIGKDPHARKDWGQEKGATENEMVGLQHQLSGHETEQTLGESEGQGSLARCSPWGHKELDTTKWLNCPCSRSCLGLGSRMKWSEVVKWNLLSCVWLFATPWTIQSLECTIQEYWSW